jgi:hypothetical protein
MSIDPYPGTQMPTPGTDPKDPNKQPAQPAATVVQVAVPTGTENLLDPAVIAKRVEIGEEENAAQRGLNADRGIQILTNEISILVEQYSIDAETMSTVRRQAIENWEHDHAEGTD